MSLADVFSAHARIRPGDDAQLEGWLAERLEIGRRAWPALAVDDAAFVRHLARHTKNGELPPVAHVADLYLACACAQGVSGAVDRLEELYAASLLRVVARFAGAAAGPDDVLQAVREHVLVARDAREPRIADYAGQAPLKSWLAAAAARTAISMGRRKGDRLASPLDSGVAEIGESVEPELALLRARHKGHVETALREALAGLSTKNRALLRLSVRDGLSIDRLAAIYGIGRSTAARWVEAARAALLDATREELRKLVALTDSEMDDLTAAVRSDLNVSIVRLLATET